MSITAGKSHLNSDEKTIRCHRFAVLINFYHSSTFLVCHRQFESSVKKAAIKIKLVKFYFDSIIFQLNYSHDSGNENIKKQFDKFLVVAQLYIFFRSAD
jgi:hypothetical protein